MASFFISFFFFGYIFCVYEYAYAEQLYSAIPKQWWSAVIVRLFCANPLAAAPDSLRAVLSGERATDSNFLLFKGEKTKWLLLEMFLYLFFWLLEMWGRDFVILVGSFVLTCSC